MQDGKHDGCTALNPRWIKSKQKQTPGIEMEISNDQGEVITHTLYVTDATVANVVKQLQYTGWNAESWDDLSTIGSKPFQIVVQSEEFNGRWYPKVAWINADGSQGGGEGQSRMSPSELKSFSAQMRGKLVAARGGKPSASPPARGTGGAPRASAPANSNAPTPGGPPSPPADHVPEGPPLGATGTDDSDPF